MRVTERGCLAMTRRLFAGMLRKIAALPLPAG